MIKSTPLQVEISWSGSYHDYSKNRCYKDHGVIFFEIGYSNRIERSSGQNLKP